MGDSLQPSPLEPGATDARRVLVIVRELATELRPHAREVSKLATDHSLERDFGPDSLARAELLIRIEHACGARVDEKTLMAAETPRDLLRLVGSVTAVVADLMTEGPPATPGAPRAAESNRLPDGATTLMDLVDWHAVTHGDQVYATIHGSGDLTATKRCGRARWPWPRDSRGRAWPRATGSP
ncbi:hypothetical protein D9M68_381660 [compost metagenome]